MENHGQNTLTINPIYALKRPDHIRIARRDALAVKRAESRDIWEGRVEAKNARRYYQRVAEGQGLLDMGDRHASTAAGYMGYPPPTQAKAAQLSANS